MLGVAGGLRCGRLPLVGLIAGCMPRQDMGEWFRRQGAMLVTYFALGSFAYSYFEGWSAVDASYFMMVTSTTVGYGDMAPETASGRLFTCVYALVGITLVLAAIAPFVEWVLRVRRAVEGVVSAAASCCVATPREAESEAEDLSVDIVHYNRRINYPLRYLRAMLGPLMVLLLGVCLALFLFGYSYIDSLYWAVVSMTTVGYGDLCPHTTAQKLVAIVYLPLAVTALADALKEVNNIALRRAIRETDYLAVADALLLDEAKGDPDETLTEAEFLISVLKSHDLVDEPTLMAIRQQFTTLTRRSGAASSTETAVLDSAAVFAELVEHGRVRQRPRGAVAGLTEFDPVTNEHVPLVNLKAIDGGYREWRQYAWLARVAEHSPTGELRSAASDLREMGRDAAAAEEDVEGEGGLSKPPPFRPPAPEYLAAKVAQLPVAPPNGAGWRAKRAGRAGVPRGEVRAAGGAQPERGVHLSSEPSGASAALSVSSESVEQAPLEPRANGQSASPGQRRREGLGGAQLPPALM